MASLSADPSVSSSFFPSLPLSLFLFSISPPLLPLFSPPLSLSLSLSPSQALASGGCCCRWVWPLWGLASATRPILWHSSRWASRVVSPSPTPHSMEPPYVIFYSPEGVHGLRNSLADPVLHHHFGLFFFLFFFSMWFFLAGGFQSALVSFHLTGGVKWLNVWSATASCVARSQLQCRTLGENTRWE